MHDLIVIGGGPAGTAAAITAAHDGADVLLLERGHYPRHKVCGEFVSAESLELLANLLTPDKSTLLRNAVRIPQARIFLDNRCLETAVNPPAASIARLELDSALWGSAASAGVETMQKTVVHSIRGAGPFLVTTSAGTFGSRTVIQASGRWSNLNPTAEENGEARWLGLKAHFAERRSSLSTDLYFFDDGYCGVQPVRLHVPDPHQELGLEEVRVNACAMVRASSATTMEEVLTRQPQLQERSRSWRLLMEPIVTFPLIFRDPCPEENGILRVGDAAGFVDPFVGDGISLALRSGRLAAASLQPFLAGQAPLTAAIRAYANAYEQQLVPVFRASSKIRQLLLLPRRLRAPLLAVLQSAPVITRYLVSKTR